MRFLLQRVRAASVAVDGREIAAVGEGLLVFIGFGAEDGPDLPHTPIWSKMLDKLVGLRVFPDGEGKFNIGLSDYADARGTPGGLLAVSQFTLYADCSRGRRPSFSGATPPEEARALFEAACAELERRLPGRVGQGLFGADMAVRLTNWGPVTMLLDSAEMARR